MWIFGSFKRDCLWFYAPGLFTLAVAPFFYRGWQAPILFTVILCAQGFFDAGHIYSTFWRTYFNREERSRTWAYAVVPALIFVAVYTALRVGFQSMMTVVLYASLFHQVRQLIGISRWYQKINRVFRPVSDYFLYALCLVPLIVAHFRDPAAYAGRYLPVSVALTTHVPTLLIYLALIAAWLVYEAAILWKTPREINRTLAVGVPSLIYGLTYLYSGSIYAFIIPLALTHAVSYMGLISLSTHRLNKKPGSSLLRIALLVTVGTTAFGVMELIIHRNFFSFVGSEFAFISSLSITMSLSHYFFDAFLWRRNHPQSAAIYQTSAAPSLALVGAGAGATEPRFGATSDGDSRIA